MKYEVKLNDLRTDTNDAAAIEFESADSYGTGKFIHVPN